MDSLSGVINVYKEKGYTSHDVVAVIKRLTRTKAGHTGTLDPDAEGVLPVCLGGATKIADYLAAEVKRYTAKLAFGTATDTQDAGGTIVEQKPLLLPKEETERVISSFTGDIMQVPPMYSALKVDGQKLYDLAREGKVVERKARPIHIYGINILNHEYPFYAEIDVTCSKGTYIRTLCADIGERCGSAAHMGTLLRTKSGKFELDQSLRLSEIKERIEAGAVADVVTPIDKALDFRKAAVSERASVYLHNGNKVALRFIKADAAFADGEKILTYDASGRLIGIHAVCMNEGFIKPVTMF